VADYRFVERRDQAFVVDVHVRQGSKWRTVREVSAEVRAAAGDWLAANHPGTVIERVWSHPAGFCWKPEYRVLTRYFTPGAEPDTFQEYVAHAGAPYADTAATACQVTVPAVWKQPHSHWRWEEAAKLEDITCLLCRRRLGYPSDPTHVSGVRRTGAAPRRPAPTMEERVHNTLAARQSGDMSGEQYQRAIVERLDTIIRLLNKSKNVEFQEYLSVADVASYTGISAKTIQRFCLRGKLRHVKIGRLTKIKKAWVDDWILNATASEKSG
jgi:excisionase family DNA binding protein